MNHFLVARRSAIAMLSSEINALDVVNATLPAQMPARAAECRRLIIAPRAGRIDDFVLPAEISVQLTILDLGALSMRLSGLRWPSEATDDEGDTGSTRSESEPDN